MGEREFRGVCRRISEFQEGSERCGAAVPGVFMRVPARGGGLFEGHGFGRFGLGWEGVRRHGCLAAVSGGLALRSARGGRWTALLVRETGDRCGPWFGGVFCNAAERVSGTLVGET